MTKIDENIQTAQNMLSWIVERCYELEVENKKLKEKIKKLEFDVDAWHQLKLLLEWEIEKLNEENKKLKNYINLIEWTVRFKDV